MSGVIVDWGSSINPMFTSDSTGDPALIRYLAAQTRAVSITTTGALSPVAVTGGTANVSDSTATLGGTVNPENQGVQYRFDHGSSPPH